MICNDCNEIIAVGNSGSDGWSPVLALYEGTCGETSVTVQQLVDWIEGSGTKPQYSGNIMTHDWLAANPIYIGTTGFVTDICDAVPLGGSAGSTGATGPTGPEGPQGDPGEPGCTPIAELNFEFTNNTEALNPPVETTVTIDNTDPCAPIYDVSIDANELFANEGLADVLIGTDAFQDALSNNTAINPTPNYKYNTGTGSSQLTLGVTTEDIQYTGAPAGYLNFSGSNNSWVEWTIVGNKMYLNFKLLLTTYPTSNTGFGGDLLLKIPDGRESFTTYYNSVINCVIESQNALDGPNYIQGIITTDSGVSGPDSDRFLRFGFMDNNLEPYYFVLDSTKFGYTNLSFIGQIVFTLK